MRISFNWLQDYVDIRIAPQALAEKLTIVGLEVISLTQLDQDTILEIEVTPNRTDCLSIIGIAREVAAITGKKLKVPKITSLRGLSKFSLPIQIQDKKLCRRYLGRVISNVQVGPSPEWLIHRLEGMGIRAVNNIVDITNFCLLEFGQPLHAFDLDRLQGQRIIVRSAREGEQLLTIDGVRRKLEPDILVIADKVSPQALAGIMGGKDTEVGPATTNILLESAYFDPLNIHNTSRKLGLATESSYRFERGVDFAGVYWGSVRAAELISKLARPTRKKLIRQAPPRKSKRKVIIGKLVDKGTRQSEQNRVRLRLAKVGEKLGVEIPAAQIRAILRNLELTIVRKSKQRLTVDIPSFRPDISREADLIEEVARLYGYDKIPLNISQLIPNLSYPETRQLLSETTYDTIRQNLCSLGLNEIMSYSLISRAALRKLELAFDNTIGVKNPLSYEQEILRPSLLVGMLNSLLVNINRKNMNLKLFELSRIYKRLTPALTNEQTNLCIGIVGKKADNWLQKSERFSFFDLKGVLEALLAKLGVDNFHFAQEQYPAFIPGRSAALFVAEENLGVLGELKREILDRFDIAYPVYVAELALPKLLACIRQEKKFVPLARFPSIARDISLFTPQEVDSGEILSLIKEVGRELVTKVTLFDQYLGEQIPPGFRGLAYSIEYRSPDRTLKAEEADVLHRRICQALTKELKAQIR